MLKKFNLAEVALYPLLKKDAMDMKHNPTEAEACMWEILRRKNLGVSFRRQFVIDLYIVDFVCLSKRLIIEVDGEYHNNEEQMRYDTQRTELLTNLGFTILRFNNNEIMVSPDSVISKIKQYINK